MDASLIVCFEHLFAAFIAFLQLIGQEELAAKIEEKIAEYEANA